VLLKLFKNKNYYLSDAVYAGNFTTVAFRGRPLG